MLFGVKQKRIVLLYLMIVTLVFAGCSLASPVGGGGAEQTTFEGPPVVRIFSPLPNQTFLEGTTVNIQARIENAGSDIAKVSIFLDDALVGEQTQNLNPSGAASFSITLDWVTSNQGQYRIAVVAERNDGTSSNRESVQVSVIKQANVGNSGGNTSTDSGNNTDTSSDSQAVTQPTATQVNSSSSTTDTSSGIIATATTAPTNTPAPPTNTPQPTATNTPSKPMVLVVSGANLRRGPSTAFDPPVGSIAANQEADIIAINPARDWYKIKYFNSEAWIYSSLVQTTGDLSSVPVDAGPPTPIPATATPLPTATPIPNPVNLYVANVAIDPHPLTCQKTAKIIVTIGNNGTQNATNGGRVRIEAILVSTGAVLESTETIFGPVAAGAQEKAATASLTVGTNYDELQRIRATVDVYSEVAENNESDNVSDSGTDYILKKGGC